MQYLALIYFPEAEREAIQERMWREYGAYTQKLADAGCLVAGEALAPSGTATRVQVRDGKRKVMDGPYAETREQVGGFYLLECADLDEAIEIAAGIPDAERGTIEVRPIAKHPVG